MVITTYNTDDLRNERRNRLATSSSAGIIFIKIIYSI